MGFFSSLWGKNTQNNTPTVQQPRMTEAQRHDAFVQSLRENTANGKYGPVPTQSTARKAATQAAYSTTRPDDGCGTIRMGTSRARRTS